MKYENRYIKLKFLELFIEKYIAKLKKAAPRFELGIKDLQSSALPLGHAADKDLMKSFEYPNSKKSNSLLIICNGHGEDVIALEIIRKLLLKENFELIEIMPLVGQGTIFDNILSHKIIKIGYQIVLPSGGFSNQSFMGFLHDVRKGMIINLFKNWLHLIKKPKYYKILAIGDLLPLIFAWSSKCEFGFIGTPKSDHTWVSGPGYSISDLYHRLKGSEWDPWEMYIMRSSLCKFVIVRDNLTSINLKKKKIDAQFFGNPMMDFIQNEKIDTKIIDNYQKLIMLIGSRFPEANYNLNLFLSYLDNFCFSDKSLILIPLSLNANKQAIKRIFIHYQFEIDNDSKFNIGEESVWSKGNVKLLVGTNKFSSWSNLPEVGLANAGTATEQICGLGIPALSIPGKGPQFNRSFAKRQERLLGGSVSVCDSKKIFIEKLSLLLHNKEFRLKQAKTGIERMGSQGASQRIVEYLNLKLLK